LKRDLDHALLALRELPHSRVVALMREVLDKRSDLVAVCVGGNCAFTRLARAVEMYNNNTTTYLPQHFSSNDR
jgi:hypothetical protein